MESIQIGLECFVDINFHYLTLDLFISTITTTIITIIKAATAATTNTFIFHYYDSCCYPQA